MAIGRLQAALAQATNEVTLAAANINFDFTLVKVEAPREFRELGNVLSRKRKDEAELGQTHITARRLGALFQGLCPSTPNLLQAYGERASEIAEYAKQKFPQQGHGMFSEHSGIDGTSIWAAATSSDTAMQVQLLACMLARIWKPHEATSVWVELVKRRRTVIAEQYERGDALPFSSLTAATQAEISRSHLAEWDASARAWLATADGVKSKAQQQLLMNLGKLDVSISLDPDVYASVVESWESALENMERIISGMPHATCHGPTLLALSSWHLYPEILIIGKTATEVQFGDPLVRAGGCLTLGLETSTDERGRGIHWSLSLAHLNFYGEPVQVRCQYDQSSAMLDFTQFSIAALGSLLAAWGLDYSSLEKGARLFLAIQDSFKRAVREEETSEIDSKTSTTFLCNPSLWWNIMARAAKAFLDAQGPEGEIASKLLYLGHRRPAFLLGSEYRDFASFSAYWRARDLVPALKGHEERISFLRKIAEQTPSQAEVIMPPIIMYFPTVAGQDTAKKYHEPQFASAYPLSRKTQRPGTSSNPSDRHSRWVTKDWFKVPGESARIIPGVSERDPEDDARFGTSYESSYVFLDKGLKHEVDAVFGHEESAALCHYKHGLRAPFRQPTLDIMLWSFESDLFKPSRLANLLTDRLLPAREPLKKSMEALEFLYGVYEGMPTAKISAGALDHYLGNPRWTNHQLAPRRMEAFACVAYLETGLDLEPESFESAFAISYGDSIYIAKQLTCDPWRDVHSQDLVRILGNVGRPGITLLIPPATEMVKPIDPSSWRLISGGRFDGEQVDHFKSTSLHLSFTNYYSPLHESGRRTQDSRVSYLESVVSIHDAGQWIGDINVLKAFNAEWKATDTIKRSKNDWAGRADTSRNKLMLNSNDSDSSSDYEQKLSAQFRDLDPGSVSCSGDNALENVTASQVNRIRFDETTCACRDNASQPAPGGSSGFRYISGKWTEVPSAESWHDILDPPNGLFIVRANGNWAARLAAVALLAQTSRRDGNTGSILICPERVCWGCFKMEDLQQPAPKALIY